jgi:NADPH-dependent 2,4-dienoyl-CoA reductase/sulfur reductase-like enzyme
VTQALDTVVVGNGAAAAEAVLALRASGHRGRVDLFSDGDLPPYNPMLGTYYVAGKVRRADCFPFGGGEFYVRNEVRARRSTGVARVDPYERRIETVDGECFLYRQCLVATGASPVVPPVPGLMGRGVVTLRSFADAVRLRGAVTSARVRAAAEATTPQAVVLGASYAGLEVTRVLQGSGFVVSLIEREATVLPRVAHPIVAEAVTRRLMSLGGNVRLGVEVTRVVAAGERYVLGLAGSGAGTEPHSSTGPDVQADLIVVCTGSRPNLDLLEASGLCSAAGIDVDEAMRTAAPGLLAAGDVARTVDPVSGERGVVALWSSARLQGRTAGLTLAGASARCPGAAPCNIQHVADSLLASGGSFAAADRIEVDKTGGSVAVLGFSGSLLVGFNLFGDVRRAGPLARALGRAPRDLGRRRSGGVVSLAAMREAITWKTSSAG